eukprot:XP_003723583.1 PREDICTED: uncharacterized protein LOC100891526 [Strongylocentrotus purpuratus]
MARSSYRLDLKRDDPRTLMIKMDARLTFAGRERNHAFHLEAERELRHLDYARHLTRSTLERQQKEMHTRMNFLKNLVEQNRARRKTIEEQGMDGDTTGKHGETIAEKRKRKEDGLRHTLPIIPARRNLEDLVKSMQTKQNSNSNMSRSLGYLSESYSQHSMQETLSERRLRHLKQEMRNAKKKEIPKVQVTVEEADRTAETPKVVWANAEGVASVSEKDKTSGGVSTQNISLPDISPGSKTHSKPTPGGRRVSLSQMIASGEIQKLPGIGPGSASMASDGTPQNLNLARTFYMNTSQNSGRGPVLQPIQNQQQKPSNKRGWVKLPPNMAALKFKEEDAEKNPFMTADFKPETYRPRELVESNKPDEMYVWLGFDSEEEYRQMVKETQEELDAESDDGDELVELEVIDELEETTEDTIEKAGAEYLKKRRMSRRVSRLSAPIAMLASSLKRMSVSHGVSNSDRSKPSSGLKRFIRAAKTICIVRKFQMNGEENETER